MTQLDSWDHLEELWECLLAFPSIIPFQHSLDSLSLSSLSFLIDYFNSYSAQKFQNKFKISSDDEYFTFIKSYCAEVKSWISKIWHEYFWSALKHFKFSSSVKVCIPVYKLVCEFTFVLQFHAYKHFVLKLIHRKVNTFNKHTIAKIC